MVPGTSMWVGKVNDPQQRQNGETRSPISEADISPDFCPG